VTFADPNSASTTASFSKPNTFVLRLTISDGEFTVSDDVTVVVTPIQVQPNLAPIIDAGPNRTIFVNEAVNLAGLVTDDGRSGKPLEITWSKRLGAGTVIFADPNSASTSATFSKPNTFVLRMTVSDGEFTITDDVTVVVLQLPPNKLPIVDAGPIQTIFVNEAVNLAGLVTDDGRSGKPLEITWSKRLGAGTVTFADPNSASTSATFSKPNTFVLRLTVSDGEFTVTDDITVIVEPLLAPEI
jgi:putative transposon-encoded protein